MTPPGLVLQNLANGARFFLLGPYSRLSPSQVIVSIGPKAIREPHLKGGADSHSVNFLSNAVVK